MCMFSYSMFSCCNSGKVFVCEYHSLALNQNNQVRYNICNILLWSHKLQFNKKKLTISLSKKEKKVGNPQIRIQYNVSTLMS